MDKLPIKKSIKYAFASAIFLSYLLFLGQAMYIRFLNNKLGSVETDIELLKTSQGQLHENLPEELFGEHLALIQRNKLEFDLQNLEKELDELKSSNSEGLFVDVNEIYDLFNDFELKVTRNTNVKLNTDESAEKVEEWAKKLLEKDLEGIADSIEKENNKLDESYSEYLATLPPPPPAPSGGYSYNTVTTEKGTTHGVYLIKVPLNDVKVKTVAAISSDCSNECPTKSLAQYINENGGFAGMNGAYACPPDYSQCAGKVNSFDYAFYDSNDRKWLNKDALTWFDTGMFTFKGNSFDFYKKTSEYGGGSVGAGISNFPTLMKNGKVDIKESTLTSYQKVRAFRGAIGMGGENIYLAHITNASVVEAAYVLKALGVKHALNLDGGGTAAMYINGQYVVGPGRSLTNAIVLTK